MSIGALERHIQKFKMRDTEESDQYHLSADQISSCFEYATEDWPFNLAEVLAQAK